MYEDSSWIRRNQCDGARRRFVSGWFEDTEARLVNKFDSMKPG
jgi:hypothetical protein